MPKLNQRGAVQFLVLILLLAGIIGGVYLIQQRTNLLPKAGGEGIIIARDQSGVILPKDGSTFLTTSPKVQVQLNPNEDILNSSSYSSITATPVIFGQTLSLDGSSYLEILNSATLNPASDFTIEAWIKPVLGEQYGYIVSKSRSAAGDDAYTLLYAQEAAQPDSKYRYHYEFRVAGKRINDSSCISPTAHSNSGTITGDNSQ